MTNPQAYHNIIARQLNISAAQVTGTLDLFAEGGTVPFIARYRKEATGSLDEVVILAIQDQHQKLIEIDKRREAIIDSLTKNELITNPLTIQLQKAQSLTELEDIYLPYRPKRKTRGLIAREKGLAPLAEQIFADKSLSFQISTFIDHSKGVISEEDALAGARDIIAEEIAEDQTTRSELRQLFLKQAIIEAKVVKKNIAQGEKFKDYFDWQEPAPKAAGHRLLAMFRGENEKILKLTIRPPEESSLRLLKKRHLKATRWQKEVATAIENSYQRLLAPSLENELCKELKGRADKEAIHVFADNLRQLLLAAPLGEKRLLALDPGYRTGAKLVCLDGQGKLLDNTTIFPTHGGRKLEEAGKVITGLVAKHRIEAIGIGNGTAGRETEEFIRSLGLDSSIIVTLVNEDGASIYSASETARTEFPDHDITVRGAVSIGRRLQDPLAELVKIDPKSIGVGQYQHDVNQSELKKKLREVVESCVNSVGVELNSASAELLTFVAGLGQTLADNIITHRNSNGPFQTRQELLKVARLGPKAFEQSAGFLRIRSGSNPLDACSVHPERYKLIKKMAKEMGVTVSNLLESDPLRESIDLKKYIDESTGLPTLTDIMEELAKPGRDPRKGFEQFHFAEGVQTMEDLSEGMSLPALITNITRFGAFADIGIKQDGLIHISQLADRFIKDPGEVVKIGQQVEVRVVEIDSKRKRIALSMRKG
ncbi:MAG: RNA-binding transcriptional accessory protein [Desulfobulbaceae bacterium]|nr:RNA-binding transcriptional accessory protein [Desulfobulbaceae bacterium]